MKDKILDKIQLRKWAKSERSKLNLKNISSELVEKLKQTEVYKNAKNIMLYYPLESEISLLSILNDEAKNFFLPKIEGKNLLCCPYKSGDELCFSCFKTLEPTTDGVNKSYIDLAIIPALAVDKNNYRLGWGGGFYDRFLRDFEGLTVVCVPKQLIVETIYPEEHDIPVNIVIS